MCLQQWARGTQPRLSSWLSGEERAGYANTRTCGQLPGTHTEQLGVAMRASDPGAAGSRGRKTVGVCWLPAYPVSRE